MRYFAIILLSIIPLTSIGQTEFVCGLKLGSDESHLSTACSQLTDYNIVTWHGKSMDINQDKGGYYVSLGVKYSSDITQAVTDIKLFNNGYVGDITYQGKRYHYCGDIWRGIKNKRYANLYYTCDGNTDPHSTLVTKCDIWQTCPAGWTDVLLANESNSATCSLCLNDKHDWYLYMVTHTHDIRYYTQNETCHQSRCSGCGFVASNPENHDFGRAVSVNENVHKAVCSKCGYVKEEKHSMNSYSATVTNHGRICDKCDYIISGEHDKSMYTHYYNVDDDKHLTRCDICSYNTNEPHSFDSSVVIRNARCSANGVGEYTCSKCGAKVRKAIPKLGHQYDEYGICTREGCTSPYQIATYNIEDSAYTIVNYGTLVSFSDMVNAGNTSINGKVDGPIIAPKNDLNGAFVPIGKMKDLAYKGSFYSTLGYIISDMKISGSSESSGLFGYVDNEGKVSGIGMRNSVINGLSCAGSISGVNNGTIADCFILHDTINISDRRGYVGGICGINNGMVVSCNTDDHSLIGSVSGYIGGICGMNTDTLRSCVSCALSPADDGSLLPLFGYGDNDAAAVVDAKTRGSFYLYDRVMFGREYNPSISDDDLSSLGVIANNGMSATSIECVDDVVSDDVTISDVLPNAAALETNETVVVYSLLGAPIRHGSNLSEAMSGLPAGIYIVDGRKVWVF